MLSAQVLPRPQLRGRSTSPVVGRAKSATFSKSPSGNRRRTKTISSAISPSREKLGIPPDLNSVEIISSSSPKRGRSNRSEEDMTAGLLIEVPSLIESSAAAAGANEMVGRATTPLAPRLIPSFEVTGTTSLDGSDRENVTLDDLGKPTAIGGDSSPNKSDSKNDSSLGIFSSIINVANNIISSKDSDDDTKGGKRGSISSLIGSGKSESNGKKRLSFRKDDDTFENKLDSLLGKHDNTLASIAANDPALAQAVQSNGIKKMDSAGVTTSNIIYKQSTNDRASLPASVVQFESVRDSPLNTLGKGDLTLASFDKRLSKSSESGGALGEYDLHSHPGSPSIQGNGSNVGRTLSMPRSISIDSKISHYTRNPLAPAISKTVTEDVADVVSGPEPSLSNSEDNVAAEPLKFALELKNRNFHQLFKEVPLTDNLIEDYSCALSKEILIQGKMYLSSNYICFKSNILGWVTNLVIPLSEVVQIEKKSTAGVFPNGIIIRTLHHRYTFATFLSRDSTFALISNVWRNVLEQVPGGGPAGRPRGSSITSSRYIADEESSPEILVDGDAGIVDEGELIDEDDIEDEKDGNGTISEEDTSRRLSTRQSTLTGSQILARGADEVDADGEVSTSTDEAKSKSNGKASAVTADDSKTFFGFPLVGPAKHGAVTMNYDKQSSDVFITDEVISAPLGVVYAILFGQETRHIIKILKDQKNFDISEETIQGLESLLKERTYNYIKPLGGPIGPKQTKCFLTDKIVDYDLDHHVLIETITLTPDVPSGSSFKVKTKMYLSWAPNNLTRLYVLTSVEWSAKSWIKGAVEKGSIEGQKDSMRVMIKDLKDIIDGFKASGAKGDKKKKRKARATSSAAAEREPVIETKPAEPEPPAPPPSIMEQAQTLFTSIVSSLGSLVEIPFVDANIVGTVMLILIIFVLRFVLRKTFGVSGNMDGHSVQFVNSDSFVSRVVIDKKEYVVIPSVESKMADPFYEKENEAALWRWIDKRTKGALSQVKPESGAEKLKQTPPEVLEFIGLAQDRLNELAGLN